MAKNSIDAYGALGKSNVLFFDPDALHLVTDPKSPLYDIRVHSPVSEKLVLNIMHHGVLQAITINKDAETGLVDVVAGRQRVKAAREANRRLAAQGCEPIQVPAIVRRAEGRDLAGVMVSENEIREADSPIGRAQKMAKLIEMGRSNEQLAILFGCGEQTIKHTLALLDTCAEVRAAVESGAVNVSQALKLGKLAPAQQREKVSALIEASEGATGHDKARKQRAVVEPGATRMRGRKEIVARMETLHGVELDLLAWVLGAD